MIEKYYNEEGKVGVIYHPDYGAGFSSWHSDPNICFDKNVIEMIVNNDWEGIKEYCSKNKIYYGGGELEIKWLDPETVFYIDEYDGLETVKIVEYPESFLIA